jgi:7-cyano-7-deazaguanine synthase
MSSSSRNKTIVLLSGGMDSLLCIALAHAQGEEIYTLHFDYGQRTFQKERECAEKIATFYNVSKDKQKIVDLNFLKTLGGSALNDIHIALSTSGENLTQAVIPTSYVPYRNTVMLSLALSFGEVIKAQKISIGAVQDDELGYPDCREIYFQAFQKMATLGGDNPHIKIETPIIKMKKDQIVKKLFELKAPVQFSWSCYQASDKACGVCDSCRLRLAAFKAVNQVDPITYK